jgi:phosphomannomutase
MDYVSKYVEFLKRHTNVKRPLKIVCDSSNGTTGLVLEKLVNIPNMELILINATPDPEFPAHGPNPLIAGATNMLSQKILEVGADFGVAFDADGDRAFFVDNRGEILPSFVIAAIWFKHSKPPFVADEIDYLSLTTTNIFKKQDITPAHVGTIFIKDAMQKNKAIFGAEFSEHFYFREFFGLDSGIFSMIYTANTLSRQDKTLAELHAEFSKQYLVNTNIAFENSNWDKVLVALKKETSTIAKAYFEREGLTIITEHGWINVRTSNTEPLIRVSVGAKTQEIAEHDMTFVTKIIQETEFASPSATVL